MKPLPKTGLLARLRAYFLTGVLITAPLGITIAVAWWAVKYIDSAVMPLIPSAYNPSRILAEYLNFSGDVPGLGLIILLVTITVIGALTAGLLGRWFVRASESILNRMPIARTLYNAIRQLLETVLKDKSNTFKKAVLVQYPREGLWAIAFVTATTSGELRRRLEGDHVSVFLPTTPNPTSGFLLFVPISEVVELDMKVEDAIKMVISAGIVTPTEELSGAVRILAGKMSTSQLEKRLYGDRTPEDQ